MTEEETISCDLCVVGAGLAGLNALYVASKYLKKKSDRVVVVDQRQNVGGMWNSVYDNVRLHQPHRLFTAGNIPWKRPRKPPGHLANKQEVLGHFQHCWEKLEKRLQLVPKFGYKYERQEEVLIDSTAGTYHAHVWFRSTNNNKEGPAAVLLVKAKRCIKAMGFNVTPSPPLALSSKHVHSVNPERLLELCDKDDKPIYIIGGGKTGIDMAHTLVEKYPQRTLELVIGRGTAFLDRSKGFPSGLKRWYGGDMVLKVFKDIAMFYDGDNDQDAMDYFRQTYGHALDESAERCLFGVVSPQEMQRVQQGASALHKEYLVDVVDEDNKNHYTQEPGTITAKFKSGQQLTVPEGSWFVNCTGHLLRENSSYERYLSERGTILSIQQTSAMAFLTSFGGYFLTHLWFMGKLPQKVPLYVFNHDELFRANRQAYFATGCAQVVYNLLLIIDHVPKHIILNCGINFDYWYPLYRSLFLLLKLEVHKKVIMTHCKKILDRVTKEKYPQATRGPLAQDSNGRIVPPLTSK